MRRICELSATALAIVVLAGCQHPRRMSSVSSSCYEGPVALRVEYPDGTPAADVPVGLGFMLWRSDPTTGQAALHAKTLHTDADGQYRRARWRECMLPTWLYAVDESRRLAAFEMIPSYDRIDGRHALTLTPACRVTGRVHKMHFKWTTRESPNILVELNPGPTRTSRTLKYESRDGRFAFLVPPAVYTLSIATSQVLWKGTRVDIPAGKPDIDLGVVQFEKQPDATALANRTPEPVEQRAGMLGRGAQRSRSPEASGTLRVGNVSKTRVDIDHVGAGPAT